VFPSHLDFVGFRWEKLGSYLAQRFGSRGANILYEARRRRDERSLRNATRFLSAKGVSNPHRFLFPLRINRNVRWALRRWAGPFYALAEERLVK